MTVVVAVSDGTTIEAGADSAASDGQSEIYEMREDKVFLHGPYLIGFCGRSLIGQILRYRTDFPDPPSAHEAPTPFLVTRMIPAIRRAVEAEGAALPGRGLLGDTTVILLGFNGRLWCINPELNVSALDRFAAIGSGRHHAYGALEALTAAQISPPRRVVELALAAAATYSPTVRPPFRFVTLGKGEE